MLNYLVCITIERRFINYSRYRYLKVYIGCSSLKQIYKLFDISNTLFHPDISNTLYHKGWKTGTLVKEVAVSEISLEIWKFHLY